MVLAKENKRDWHDYLTLVLAAAAFVTSCFVGLFSCSQANSAHQSLDYQLAQTRAYVGVTEISAASEPQAGMPFVTRLGLQNFGSTPALNVNTVNEAWVVPINSLNAAALPSEINGPSSREIALFPKITIQSLQTSAIRLTPDAYSAIVSRNSAIMSFGVIHYRDTFGHARFTQYCGIFIYGLPATSCQQYHNAD